MLSNVEANASATVTGGEGFHTPLDVTVNSPNISYFDVFTFNGRAQFGIDDLSFDRLTVVRSAAH